MKTTTALPAPALSYKLRVKKLLIKGIIYLTSDKFSIFVGVIAAMVSYVGVLLDDDQVVANGGIVFVAGLIPRAWREGVRDIRRHKLGADNDKR